MLGDIIFSLVIGGTVGIFGHVRKFGKLVMPRRTKRFVYPGFLQEMFLGAVASLLLMLYLTPHSYVEKMVIGIVAGMSGDSVLANAEILKEFVKK